MVIVTVLIIVLVVVIILVIIIIIIIIDIIFITWWCTAANTTIRTINSSSVQNTLSWICFRNLSHTLITGRRFILKSDEIKRGLIAKNVCTHAITYFAFAFATAIKMIQISNITM